MDKLRMLRIIHWAKDKEEEIKRQKTLQKSTEDMKDA